MGAFAFIAVAFAVGIAKGDMPLPPPSEITAMSPNSGIRAISDPKAGTRVEDANREKFFGVCRSGIDRCVLPMMGSIS